MFSVILWYFGPRISETWKTTGINGTWIKMKQTLLDSEVAIIRISMLQKAQALSAEHINKSTHVDICDAGRFDLYAMFSTYYKSVQMNRFK